MQADIKHAKDLVCRYQKAFDTASVHALETTLTDFIADAYLWYGMHPFHAQTGAGSVVDVFWRPLRHSLTALQRRQDIFFAGCNEVDGFTSLWVASMGHFMGLFDVPFLGIPATKKMVMLRYAEFHKVEENKITQTALFVDLLHLMAQTGHYHLPGQTAMHFVQPGPRTHDGVLCAAQDETETKRTLALISRMIADINQGGYTTPRDEVRQCWHEDMIWWGPAGIGATYTIERYIEQHQRPFRALNEGRRFHGHVCRMAEGCYGGFFGWPNLSVIPSGGYLSMPAYHDYADMRVVDIYRREHDKLAENWVFIDMLHFLHMQGQDILGDICGD